MGSKNSITNEDSNYINEIKIPGHGNPITIKQFQDLVKKSENSTFKIEFFGQKGTGFFFEQNISSIKYYNKYFLMTNNHVLNQDFFNNNTHLEIEHKNKQIIIPLNNRIKYTNEELDFTIIEILPTDDFFSEIKYFFTIDNYIMSNNSESNYLKKDICIFQYPNGEELSFDKGEIKSINDYQIKHLVSTEPGSSGSPILLLNNFTIIGIHQAGGNENKEDNKGIFMKNILNDINNINSEENIIGNIISLKIGSYTTSISLANKKDDKITYDLKLLDNNTYRTIPSIYTFESNTKHYIGNAAKAHLKKNIDYTIENISRLISIEPDTEFGKIELDKKNLKYCTFDDKQNKFKVQNIEENATRLPSEIVSNFINILKKEYLQELKKDEMVYFSIPDYFTFSQKEKCLKLLEENSLKAFLIPESVAISLYYGYTKSQDLFSDNNDKYVILVDVGHSKTIFVLVKYSKDYIFTILDVHLVNIGGRDMDYNIYNYLTNEKVKEREIKAEKILKFKYKIYEDIKEVKKMLCVNSDYDLQIDKLDGENKIEIQITRKDFEEKTKPILDEINKEFNDFLLKCYERLDPNMVSNMIIECLSDLLKIPYLRNNMNNNKYKIKVFQTVQSDENVPIGCSLYASYLNKNLKNIKGIYGYNYYDIYYKISGEEKVFCKKGESIPKIKKINIENIDKNNLIIIEFYYKEKDIEYYSHKSKICNVEFIPNDSMKADKNKEITLYFNIEINGNIEFVKAIREYKLEDYSKKKQFIHIKKEDLKENNNFLKTGKNESLQNNNNNIEIKNENDNHYEHSNHPNYDEKEEEFNRQKQNLIELNDIVIDGINKNKQEKIYFNKNVFEDLQSEISNLQYNKNDKANIIKQLKFKLFKKVDENCDKKIYDKKIKVINDIQEKIDREKANKKQFMIGNDPKDNKDYKEKIQVFDQKINHLEQLKDRMCIAIDSNDFETVNREYEKFKKTERQITKK